MTELAKFLRTHLDRRDWSNRTLAMYAEVSPSTVGNWLNGQVVPSPEALAKVAAALEVDLSTLLRMAGHLEERPQNLTNDRLIDLALRVEALPGPLRDAVIAGLAAQVDALDSVIDELYEEARRLHPDMLAEAEEEEPQAHERGDSVSARSPG